MSMGTFLKKFDLFSFLLGLCLSTCVFAVYSIVVGQQSSLVSFEKKQACQALRSEIEGWLDETYAEPLYDQVEMDDLFYSPGRDTCVYTYRVWARDEGLTPSFYLEDALTNEKLFEIWLSEDSSVSKNGESVDRFDEVVKEYKDPLNNLDDLPVSKHLRR